MQLAAQPKEDVPGKTHLGAHVPRRIRGPRADLRDILLEQLQ